MAEILTVYKGEGNYAPDRRQIFCNLSATAAPGNEPGATLLIKG